VGAGHGGKAMAADLATRGFAVNLYNRSAERIKEIALRGAIELEREDNSHRLGRLALVTSDIAEALQDSDVVMVVLPASGHRDVAWLCAPHLRDGQSVVLNPGRTGGALEFRQILDQAGCGADVTVAEAGTFIFASRSTGPTEARIFRRKNTVPLAALPATRTGHVLEAVCEAFPQFIPVFTVISPEIQGASHCSQVHQIRSRVAGVDIPEHNGSRLRTVTFPKLTPVFAVICPEIQNVFHYCYVLNFSPLGVYISDKFNHGRRGWTKSKAENHQNETICHYRDVLFHGGIIFLSFYP
jgi:hypothetical protein